MEAKIILGCCPPSTSSQRKATNLIKKSLFFFQEIAQAAPFDWEILNFPHRSLSIWRNKPVANVVEFSGRVYQQDAVQNTPRRRDDKTMCVIHV